MNSDGLMTAIRRILQSISGKYSDLYPQLETILQQPILEALNDPRATAIDEALSCLAELLFNQPQISTQMWNYFQLLVNSLMSD